MGSYTHRMPGLSLAMGRGNMCIVVAIPGSLYLEVKEFLVFNVEKSVKSCMFV